MTNREQKVLITGQFWDREFADLLRGISLPTTLLTPEQLERTQDIPEPIGLVILAQSGRDSVSPRLVQKIQQLLGTDVPLINLLGSWCEGQERSGKPLSGVIPLYWHQWTGGTDQLIQLAQQRWSDFENGSPSSEQAQIGISALSPAAAELLQDSLQFLGLSSHWLEQQDWQGLPHPRSLSAVVVDGDSLTEGLLHRLQQIESEFPGVRRVVLLGFPRKEEVAKLLELPGMTSVLSKPCDLASLAKALEQALGFRLISPGDDNGKAFRVRLRTEAVPDHLH